MEWTNKVYKDNEKGVISAVRKSSKKENGCVGKVRKFTEDLSFLISGHEELGPDLAEKQAIIVDPYPSLTKT